MDNVAEKMNSSVCYSIQINDSLDRAHRDNKFVTIRSRLSFNARQNIREMDF